MNNYRVWINQVNQSHYDVEARTLESAMNKAEQEWREDNVPRVSYVEKDGKEVWPEKD